MSRSRRRAHPLRYRPRPRSPSTKRMQSSTGPNPEDNIASIRRSRTRTPPTTRSKLPIAQAPTIKPASPMDDDQWQRLLAQAAGRHREGLVGDSRLRPREPTVGSIRRTPRGTVVGFGSSKTLVASRGSRRRANRRTAGNSTRMSNPRPSPRAEESTCGARRRRRSSMISALHRDNACGACTSDPRSRPTSSRSPERSGAPPSHRPRRAPGRTGHGTQIGQAGRSRATPGSHTFTKPKPNAKTELQQAQTQAAATPSIAHVREAHPTQTASSNKRAGSPGRAADAELVAAKPKPDAKPQHDERKPKPPRHRTGTRPRSPAARENHSNTPRRSSPTRGQPTGAIAAAPPPVTFSYLQDPKAAQADAMSREQRRLAAKVLAEEAIE